MSGVHIMIRLISHFHTIGTLLSANIFPVVIQIYCFLRRSVATATSVRELVSFTRETSISKSLAADGAEPHKFNNRFTIIVTSYKPQKLTVR